MLRPAPTRRRPTTTPKERMARPGLTYRPVVGIRRLRAAPINRAGIALHATPRQVVEQGTIRRPVAVGMAGDRRAADRHMRRTLAAAVVVADSQNKLLQAGGLYRPPFLYLQGRVFAGSAALAIIEDVSQANVRKLAEANFPTRWGQFRIYGFEGEFPAKPNGDAAEGRPITAKRAR